MQTKIPKKCSAGYTESIVQKNAWRGKTAAGLKMDDVLGPGQGKFLAFSLCEWREYTKYA